MSSNDRSALSRSRTIDFDNSWLATGSELLRSTNVHGVKYLLASFSNSRRWDRVFWSFFILLASVSIGYLAAELLMKQANSPLIISINFETNPSDYTRFPAITVCDTHVLGYNRSRELLKKFGYDESETDLIFTLANDMTAFGNPRLPPAQFDAAMRKLNLTMNDLLSFMYKQNQACSEMFVQCTWQNREFDCNDHILHHLTDMGKTYRRLSFPYKNGSVETFGSADYESKNKQEKSRDIMGRTFTGISWGLAVLLKTARSSNSQLKVYVHHPGDAPDMYQRALPVASGSQIFFGVRTSRIYTTSQAKVAYRPEVRECYSREEGSVYDVKDYSVPNCQSACVIHKSINNCNCIPYYYAVVFKSISCPLIAYCFHYVLYFTLNSAEKANVTICRTSKYSCLKEHVKWNPMIQTFNPKCDLCKPGCAQTSYDTSVSRVPIRFVKSRTFSSPVNKADARQTLIQLNVYLSDYLSIVHKRDVLYGWSDLLSGIGGVMSICIGFCLVNVAEVVYFLTLRWFVSRLTHPGT